MQRFEVFNPIVNTSSTYFIDSAADAAGIKYQSNVVSTIETELSLIWEKLNFLQRTTPEFVELSCKNCGGKIQQKYKDPIFKCPYCKTVYAIGIKQVNSV